MLPFPSYVLKFIIMVENENNNDSSNEKENNDIENKKNEKDFAQILGELKNKAAEILNSDVELEVEIQPDSKNSKKNGKKGKEKKSVLLPAEDFLPAKLPVIPLLGHPVFPGIFTPLMINSPGDIKAAEEAYEGDGYLGIVMLKDEVPEARYEDLHKVGTAAKIIKKINLPDGGINVFISTVKRFRMKKCLSSSAPIVAAVDYLEEVEDDTFEVKALTRALISEMKEVAENNPLFTEEMRLNMVNIDNPGKIADFIASILNVEKEDQQRVLETLNVRQRMEQVLVFIKKEQELLRVQKKIQNDINEKVEKNQRDYFLREELKSIQEELGTDAEGNLSDYQKYKKEIEKFNFSGEIKETLESELEKFKILDIQSPEYTVSRNYLELVCQLPWNEEIKVENYSLEGAKKLLDGDHYGLEDVKKRILEYLAVRKLKKDGKGSILILVGPPGCGKTSVGKSIANAMGKPFYRFSVGGMSDPSEIKGHRRTYIGSMCGKIISGIKLTHTKSPVFMIDEVDKMSSNGVHGDPAAALLEVLDPEQNVSFRDDYLDLPFDVSNVFFILTANTLDSIPEPLLDRAEIIQLAGYIDQEKLEIARKYLIPKNLKKNGLSKNQVKYTKEALLRIAQEYAREAGVRNYEKYLDKIHRKLVAEEFLNADKLAADAKKQAKKNGCSAEEIAQISADKYFDEKKQFVIDAPDLEKYLGKPVFDEAEIKKANIPGTAIGLAWTSMGGDTLLIECMSFPGKPDFVITGQMGDVMKESAQIAMDWIKRYVIERKIKKPAWFEHNTIHLHIPEGATPKDGPSAGITMATTFLSLFAGKTIKPNLAMTGELSLTGNVLPIGGLREKTVAAKRNRIKTIIIPKANERDLDEIPEIVKAGITFIPVSRIEEVIANAFKAKL